MNLVRDIQACNERQADWRAHSSLVDRTKYRDAVLAACDEGLTFVVRQLLAWKSRSRAARVVLRGGVGFILACRQGHVGTAAMLLERMRGVTSLHRHVGRGFRVACDAGQTRVVEMLLELQGLDRVNVHAHKQVALWSACRRGHNGVVAVLLALSGERRVDVNVRARGGALHAACHGGHLGVVRQLLALRGERAVDVHRDNEAAFRAACRRGHVDVARELLALRGDRAVDVHALQEAALRGACARHEFGVVRLLLTLGNDRLPDVHAKEDSALRIVCLNRDVVSASWVLARGTRAFAWVVLNDPARYNFCLFAVDAWLRTARAWRMYHARVAPLGPDLGKYVCARARRLVWARRAVYVAMWRAKQRTEAQAP
uniref:Uncharacterized protein n=1 Tax=viral metagenome TaxID=1070528 RepID=A0A6C0ATW2_9ZZZZ